METKTAVQFPKIAIRFCVQCKWNLRAAYYAQELLQTFSNTIGEVSLIPVTGGIFNIILYTNTNGSDEVLPTITETLIWDRKRDGGFPETKELKNRVRNVIDPDKDMGHVDRALKKSTPEATIEKQNQPEEKIPADHALEKGSPEATTEKQDQPEEKNPIDHATKGGGHNQHKVSAAPEEDCEECRESMREETAKTGS